MNLTNKQINEMKQTYKGKFKLFKLGIEKYKSDPSIYRIHLMQGLSTKLTIYMIIFASIYSISIGFWVFALIILPIGTIGNYYSMKSHLIKYKNSVLQYEMAGILKPIDKDISNLRRKWRIIEKQIGFIGLDLIFLLFVGVMTYAYYSSLSLYARLGIVLLSFIPLYVIYFVLIYSICNHYYLRSKKC